VRVKRVESLEIMNIEPGAFELEELKLKFDRVYERQLRRAQWSDDGERVEFQFCVRYIRIVRGTVCIGFIDRWTGDILFPTSWNAPSRNHPRGNIYDPDGGRSAVRWYGVATAMDMRYT